MERYQVSRNDSGFYVEGFPDAAKLIQLEGPKARRLADLALHRSDLDFARECLTAINGISPDNEIARQALWRSAIVQYAKCFGSSKSRFQLQAAAIYKGDPMGLQIFEYFSHMRDKHVAHDENAYAQCTPGAVINKPDKPHKVEKILCTSMFVQTLDQINFGNLVLLVQKAHAWVVLHFDNLCALLTKELEALPYDALLQRPAVTQRVPTPADVNKARHAAL